jgi:hypothetical protein
MAEQNTSSVTMLTELVSTVLLFELGHGRPMTGSGHRVARPCAHRGPRRCSCLLDEGKIMPTPSSAYLTSPYLSLVLAERKSQGAIAAASSLSSCDTTIAPLPHSTRPKLCCSFLYLDHLLVGPIAQRWGLICHFRHHLPWTLLTGAPPSSWLASLELPFALLLAFMCSLCVREARTEPRRARRALEPPEHHCAMAAGCCSHR